jgi:hypothetical protein
MFHLHIKIQPGNTKKKNGAYGKVIGAVLLFSAPGDPTHTDISWLVIK